MIKYGAIAIALFMAAAAHAQTMPSGHWAFEGDGVDATGGGADLTLFGAPSFAPGPIGQALVLNGVDQHAERSADDEVWDFGGNDFTIRAYVAFDDIESLSGQFIVAKWFLPAQGWYLRYNGPMGSPATGRIFHFTDGQGTINFYGTAAPGALVNGQFAQILVRRSGMSIEMYLDCVLIGSQTTAAALGNASRALTIGVRHTSTNTFVERMRGKIDDVRIWTSALSDLELASLCAPPPMDAGVDPDATDPDATDPDATDPDATDPDAADPDAADLDAGVELDAGDPDAADPDAADPDAADLDAMEPIMDAAPDPDAALDPDAEPQTMDARGMDAEPAADAGVVRDAGAQESTTNDCECSSTDRSRGRDGDARSIMLFLVLAMMLTSLRVVRK